MKKISILLLSLICIMGNAQQIKVVCVGASITEGAGVKNRKENAWPGQLQSLLGTGFKVENYGIGGTTMLSKGNFPYCNTPSYHEALRSNPDIVLIDLGGNDAKAINRPFYDELEQDACDMISSFKKLPSKPRVIVMLPTAFFVTDQDGIYDPVCRKEVTPRLQKAANKEGVETVDMHQLLINHPELIPDKIHPNEKGAGFIAKRLFQQLTIQQDITFDIFPKLKAGGVDYKRTEFAGYECASFTIDGRDCKVVKPCFARKDRPWIWRARFWAHEPQTDIALLERGYHLVYYDQSGLLGNKECITNWSKFYDIMHTAGLADKVVLEGMSRGAMYALNWAAANPTKVAAVYIDNPLLDCRYIANRPDNEISRDLIKAYNLPDKKAIARFNGSPTDKIKEIVSGNYPILILCADQDEAVPLETVKEFEKKILKAGGNLIVTVKEGFNHHPHSFPNPAPIIDFIETAIDKNAFTSEKRYDSYKGLAMAGYQGWFSCPGDGADRGWYHYTGSDGSFRPGSCKIDMWPDVSEYSHLYKTEFRFADGSPAYTISEYDESTVETHFRWMREYGIDGVFIQRFIAEIKRPKSYNQLNKVWQSAINAANDNNRAISAMYDLSGMSPGDEKILLDDIDYLEATYKFKDRNINPSYLYHNGKPLVVVWGVGFNDNRRYGFKESEIIINGLIERGYSVMIGVPTHWRLLTRDTMNDKELHRLIRKCDIVMPWFVGRYNEGGFDPFELLVKEDIAWCKKNKLDYAPLAFPGFSWKNMRKDSTPIDRNRGSFYWRQLSSHIANGAEMLYLAMFDEIDEGTAIFKCATEIPIGESYFLPLDKDLGSDYYLFLAGEAARMLRKERPFSNQKPNPIGR